MATRLFPPGSDDVIYVVDLSSYVLRAYHAVAPLLSPGGEPTGAVHGMVNMLELMLREQTPRLLAVALDSGRETFRKQIYSDYKANRPPAPDDLRSQLQRCEQIVNGFHAAIYKQDGVEADDLIATVVRRAREDHLKVVILAADKDLMQLVGEDVLLWDTMRSRVIGVPEVEERFGVRVDQLQDLLALMGDTSDNIPGVPSVGPKTAMELLKAHGTLQGIYDNLDKIAKKGLLQKLTEHREQAFLSQRLVALKDDCDIVVDREALTYRGRDVEKLGAIYSELGFTRQLGLLTAAPAVAPSQSAPPAGGAASARAGMTQMGLPLSGPSGAAAAPPPAPRPVATIPADYGTLFTPTEIAEFAASLRAEGQIGLEIVTTEDSPTRSALVGLALAGKNGRARYVPIGHRLMGIPKLPSATELGEALGGLLSAEGGAVVSAHDLKRADIALSKLGVRIGRYGSDGALASYLIDPETRHDRVSLAQRELGLVTGTLEELAKPARGKRVPVDELLIEPVSSWACENADYSLRLASRLGEKLDDHGLTPLYRDLELPLAQELSDMELNGVLVDQKVLSDLGRQCDAEIVRLEQEAHRVAGREFNPNSPRQLETLLFDELGLKPLKRTKTSRSTDAETLEALSDKHELPRVILELRQVSKLKGTYIDALPSLLDPKTGRVHSSWEQAVAATGRLSSTDPNLQNIPIRTELGRRIRAAFVAQPGHRLVSADYSQIELRVLAHLSQDPVLCESFRTREDVHQRTAMEIFEVKAEELTREMRTRAKAVNFGVIYGQGDSGLSKVLGVPRAEASNFIAAYFRRYQGVRTFMTATLERARTGEAVRSLLGRHRLLPNIRSANRAERLAAERIAMNMPIQGSAADILKLAMLKLRVPPTPGARMVLSVHDELVFEVPEAEVAEAEQKIKVAMESAYELTVPLEVSVGHGQDWNSAH
ncbi:MAG: DNA polymerase I [Myxococcales bacterium]|nr:MAG: DNA polymerase I [Myxococcales bacterium]